MLMYFASTKLNTDCFVAKIGYANEASIALFHKLQFVEVSRCDVFKEVTLELKVSIVYLLLEEVCHDGVYDWTY